MDAIPTTACFIAEVELTMSDELLGHLGYSFRVFGITPRNLTGPLRPSSATLMDMVAL